LAERINHRNQDLRHTLQHLLHIGVRVFIDLTQAYEFSSYEKVVLEEATTLNLSQPVNYYRQAIKDRSVTTPMQMQQILDIIDAANRSEQAVYVHCMAGVGRIGTVVGCYLVRHGLMGIEALAEINRLRANLPMAALLSSPSTEEQRQMVLDWAIGQ
jgi:protein-tyrosine phosphatase